MYSKRLLILLSTIIGNAGMATAQVADIAGVLAGDRWVYEVTDEMTGELKSTTTTVVLGVSENEINTRHSIRGAAHPQLVVFDPGWSRIDDSIWQFRPSDGTGFQSPLEIAKEWRFENSATHLQNGTSLRTSGQSKVVGNETVTTSAGIFDTFKVETVMRQVSSNDQTATVTVNITSWYAPAVNRWVRKTYSVQVGGRLRDAHTEELTDYSRKP